MNINPIQEYILIEALLDGCEKHGEKFSQLLSQDLTFENKERVLSLVIDYAIEYADHFVTDPENISFEEDVFDSSVSKIYISNLLEFKAPAAFKPSLRSRHLAWAGKGRISAARKISKAAGEQIASGRSRLFGSGQKSVGDAMRAARDYAGGGYYGRAAGHLARAGYHAGRGALSMGVGAARKGLAQQLRSSGRRLVAAPQREQEKAEKLSAIQQGIQQRRMANVPSY